MITIRVGGLPIHIGAKPLQDLIAAQMPGGSDTPGAQMPLEDRQAHIALKLCYKVIIPWAYKRLRKAGVAVEAPDCPKGMDYNRWGLSWLLSALMQATGGAVVDLNYAEMQDGSLLVTGVAPALAGPVVDAERLALPQPGSAISGAVAAPIPPDERSATASAPAALAGPDDRDESVGSLVHPGADGQRENALCETPAV